MFVQFLCKEFRMQIVHGSFALGLAALWGLAFALSFVSKNQIEMFQIVHYFIVFPGLIFILPMLMGSDGAAGERNNQTLERQLSLPFDRRWQWALKAAVTVAMAAVVCGGLSLFLDAGMAHYISLFNVEAAKFIEWRFWPGFGMLFFIALGYYVSSVSKDTLSAFTAASFGWGVSILYIYLLCNYAESAFDYLGVCESIRFNADYSLLNVNASKQPGSQVVANCLYYARILALSLFLFVAGCTNFRLNGFRFVRILLHGIGWFVLLTALAVLNW